MVHFEKGPPWGAEAVRALDETPFQMQWPVGGGSAETKECKPGTSAKMVGLDRGRGMGGWREEVRQRRMREEAEGRCMSPERKETARSHKPRRLGHQSGSY